MQISITDLNPDYLVYGGAVGILLGFGLLTTFLFRRILWLLRILAGRKPTSPKLFSSIRNFLFIMVWTALLGMVLFFGFFLRAYAAFTYEKPVAEVIVRSSGTPEISRITLAQFLPDGSQTTHEFLIRGDQWMIEGDILKWENWLNFLGLHTRYRLTRLRGRYLSTESEIREPHTIYSLVDDEDHPIWHWLYQYGHRFPFVSAVYGNATFQASKTEKRYAVYVGTSGFLLRPWGENGDFPKTPL